MHAENPDVSPAPLAVVVAVAVMTRPPHAPFKVAAKVTSPFTSVAPVVTLPRYVSPSPLPLSSHAMLA
jgi:hypothetical protein